jgi:uncharacterized membrane protein
MDTVVKYLIIFVLLMVFDVIWIYLNVNSYSNSIQKVQKSAASLRYEHAFIAYIIIVFSVLYVAIPFTTQNMKKEDVSIADKLLKAFMYGGAVGFSIYGIYNFTSLAIYKETDSFIGIIDTIWGTTLYTLMTFIYLLLP